MFKTFYLLIILLLFELFNFSKSWAEDLYLLIDKATNQLKIMSQEKPLAIYEIGWGLKSSLPKQKRGDFLTPEGAYEIVQIRPSSTYLYFIELNYPNLNDLAWGYYYGLLTKKQFENFSSLFFQKRKILSPLGQEIGIHGGGAFKEEKKGGQIYKNYNWTKGCISLSNEDLIKLLNLVTLRQKVFIIDSSKNLYEILEKLVYPKEINPLEFFQGELYLKINNFICYKFILKKYFNGSKYLILQELHKGILIKELISQPNGTFELLEEQKLKTIILSKIYLIENF